MSDAEARTSRGTREGDWKIAVDSIGEAGARLVSMLRPVANLPEADLAQLLFQAPSVVLDGLSEDVASAVNDILRDAGLESRVLGRGETIEEGDSSHEIALVIDDLSNMAAVLTEVVNRGVGATVRSRCNARARARVATESS